VCWCGSKLWHIVSIRRSRMEGVCTRERLKLSLLCFYDS
jgi:hypothetical protein